LRLDSRLRDLILQAPKHKRMERNRVWIPELAFEATKRGTKQALNNKVFFFLFLFLNYHFHQLATIFYQKPIIANINVQQTNYDLLSACLVSW
jgi:hypothetical protein